MSGTGTEIQNLVRDSSGTGTGWKMAGTGRNIGCPRLESQVRIGCPAGFRFLGKFGPGVKMAENGGT